MATVYSGEGEKPFSVTYRYCASIEMVGKTCLNVTHEANQLYAKFGENKYKNITGETCKCFQNLCNGCSAKDGDDEKVVNSTQSCVYSPNITNTTQEIMFSSTPCDYGDDESFGHQLMPKLLLIPFVLIALVRHFE